MCRFRQFGTLQWTSAAEGEPTVAARELDGRIRPRPVIAVDDEQSGARPLRLFLLRLI
jgi:hypothetical protein